MTITSIKQQFISPITTDTYNRQSKIATRLGLNEISRAHHGIQSTNPLDTSKQENFINSFSGKYTGDKLAIVKNAKELCEKKNETIKQNNLEINGLKEDKEYLDNELSSYIEQLEEVENERDLIKSKYERENAMVKYILFPLMIYCYLFGFYGMRSVVYYHYSTLIYYPISVFVNFTTMVFQSTMISNML